MGALRLGGLGAVTPSLRRGRLRGLSPEHLQQGRFLLFSANDSPDMTEIAIWTAAASPVELPHDEWTLMIPSSLGMTPEGWEEQEPPSLDECRTDLTHSRGLGLALQQIRARKAASRAQAAASEHEDITVGAPTGLVRHLQAVIDRQRMQLESLQAEVETLKRRDPPRD